MLRFTDINSHRAVIYEALGHDDPFICDHRRDSTDATSLPR